MIELKPDPRDSYVKHDKEEQDSLLNVKQILSKIDEINRNQSSQTTNHLTLIGERLQDFKGRSYDQVPQEIFKNPIIEYLQRVSAKSGQSGEETLEKGITRKITHHQTFVFPSYDPALENYLRKPVTDLENQAVENVKSIVTSQQYPVNNNLYNYSPYYPYYSQTNIDNHQGKQWSPPFQNLFPIVIQNPFQMMFNAFTSMVEYGPEADVCKNQLIRDGRLLKENTANKDEIIIDDIDVNSLRNEKELHVNKKKKRPRPSTIAEDKEESEEKGLFTSDNNRRNVNRHNVGGGIFIHKLRVRKGGVAIAGPGGIATAGTGGTAIVGPNGYAYTHPDSLAIAGTGTKVIAVDPSIDLAQIINESNRNKTKSDDSISRFGKIVAVGPVVYYNQG